MGIFNKKLSKENIKNNRRNFDTGRIYMAEVMDTRNVSKSGEILVYLIGSNLDREDSENWMLASYASNFFGTTPYDNNNNPDYNMDPKSFGAWFPMPCVGNYVFVFFPVSSGENTNLFWFACPVNPNTNYMVPGIPSKFNDEEHCPLCERNDKSYSGTDNKKFNENIIEGQEKQAVYTPLKDALVRQGLTRDGIRGYSTAGAKRESPSMCYGFLTPMGNSLVIDDGWSKDDNKTTWTYTCNDQDKLDKGDIKQKRKLVGSDEKCPWQRTYDDEITNDKLKRNNAGFRLRTRNGTQVLIADEGTIYAINADGSCWVEISKNGYLECWSKYGISATCEKDINLHAGGNIYIEADKKIALNGREGINIESTGDMNIYGTKHINTDASISATEILAEQGNISVFQSGGADIIGTFSGTLDGTAYFSTYTSGVPVLQPAATVYEPDIIKPKEQPKNEVNGEGYDEKSVKKIGNTINTKITTHEPYYYHCPIGDIEELQDNFSTPLPTTNNECEGCNASIGTNVNNKKQVSVTNQVCKNPATNTVNKKPVGENVPEMQLSKHFTLRQLCYSDTANRNHIKNVPTQEAIDNLKILAENILEPIYREFDGRVQINSGYRGPELNNLVNGASGSQHTTGQAVDVEVPGLSTWDLCHWVDDNLEYDQLILENCTNLNLDPNSGWVHCSFNPLNNRKQKLTCKNSRYISGFHR